MGQKLVVGPITKGLRNNVLPFNVDNDAFPVLMNAYEWRSRIKRKRGTGFIARLTRYFNSTLSSYGSITTITLDGAGHGNLLTGFDLQPNGNIVPGSVTITDTVSTIIYTDPAMNGTLSPSGSINYATGVITIAAAAGHTISAIFLYYPDLPVMGLRDFYGNTEFPGTLAFDTTYAYNLPTVFNTVLGSFGPYSVSFYKNPAASASLPGYIPKTNPTPTSWNGQDYQQFWSINYEGAFWVTNGVTDPFTITNIGMQYGFINTVTVTSGGPPAIVTLSITAHGLVVGDFLFINEVVTTTGINYQTGYVIAVIDANTVSVEFPNATIATNGTGGIAQYLTNRSNVTQDCLRWYDGDPTNGSSTMPTLTGVLGWVNFAPPISLRSFSVGDEPAAQYYLIGAKVIFNFKDRILFFGPVLQTSALNSQVYLQDTVIYSQNGTPYYTASFTDTSTSYPLMPTTPPGYVPILVPIQQTAVPSAYFEDVTGFGGSITAGIDQAINTVGPNEDVLIVGFTRVQTKLVYSGNDVIPFNFFIVNSELGSGSTFSTIVMDKGVMSKGSRGYTMTSQVETERIDLLIPDENFETSYLNNGVERVTAQRDFINEWIYFTYPNNDEEFEESYKFPNQTLQFNYRENTWAIFRETYTTYGLFRKQTGFTWATVYTIFPTWEDWSEPWNWGSSNLLQPAVIGGNQQGFILQRDVGTGESNSLYIQNIVGNTITSPDHTLDEGDYIVISGALGTVGPVVNGNIYSVAITTENTFTLNPPLSSGFTYLGGGLIKRMYVPFIQTRQFPLSWEMARKTRIGPQQYLLTTTANGQITLLIFLSQDATNPFNISPYYPDPNAPNPAVIYSTVLYTCPESTNLGLTPANSNLQMPIGISQQQIWHRMNTSLIGDTVQIGFTMSDTQMRDTTFSNQFAEIEIHSMILDINPSMLLA